MSRRLTVNPVLSRELRQRVRSRRAATVLTVYLSLLVAAVGLMVWGTQRASEGDSDPTQSIGQTVFGSLLFLILGLVCFIVPGVAAGAVAGERERLTLMPLQVTLLTPGQVLRGKLLASLAFTTLLLVATLPLLAVAYVLGGVSVAQVAGGLFFVLASAAFLGVVSIWASTVLRRVQRATVVAYGLVGVLVIGTPIAYGVQALATSRPDREGGSGAWESLVLLAPNPFLVTADALGHGGDGAGGSPFSPSQEALRRRDERRQGVGGVDEGIAVAPPALEARPVPPAAPAARPAPPAVNEPTAAVAPPATATVGPQRVPVQTTAVASEPPPGWMPPTTAWLGSNAPQVVEPSRPPMAVEPRGGRSFEPDGSRFESGTGGGDVTDWGPIWVWSFGWWAVLGGAAYLHASRRLRLPSVDGVRP